MNLKSKNRYVFVWVLICVLFPVSFLKGQAKAKKGPKQSGVAKVSLVYLGAKPPRRFKESKDGPIMLPPLEGETPPNMLYYRGIDPKTEKSAFMPVSIPFNQSPKSLLLPAPASVKFYQTQSKDDTKAKAYLSFPSLGVNGHYFIIILPKGKGKEMWSQPPVVALIDLKKEEYLESDVLFINYTSQDVQTLFGSKNEDLLSGEKISYKKVIKGKYIRASSKYKNRKTWIFSRPIVASEGKISLIIFYDADPLTNAGRDVGVMFTEIDRD